MKYYLTAMLFIIFDIEIVFLYPWAVYFDSLGVFGLDRDGAVHLQRLGGVRLRMEARRTELGLTARTEQHCPKESVHHGS